MSKEWYLIVGIVFVFFLLLNLFLWRERRKTQQKKKQVKEAFLGNRSITALHLLNEKMETIREWGLCGKTAVLIGRIPGNEPDEIDLSEAADAMLISKEHAVLNYVAGAWYLEDLSSENGTRVRRAGETETVMLVGQGPYRLERGDIILIAQTPLLVA